MSTRARFHPWFWTPPAPLPEYQSPPGWVFPGWPMTPTMETDAMLKAPDVKFYLQGLISRDPEAPPPGWYETPAGQAALKAAKEKRAAYERGDLMMVSLSESHDGGFSLKYVEVDRAALRRLIADGWVFDKETTTWANATK